MGLILISVFQRDGTIEDNWFVELKLACHVKDDFCCCCWIEFVSNQITL